MADNLIFPIRSDKLSMNVAVLEHVLNRTTEHQQIDILDTEVFGRILLLDGHIQLTEFDEHAYHEALVQIPLMSLSAPSSALVVGGGDGGVIRELCRSADLTHIDIVEIDAGVIEASREYMPGLSAGAFDNSRVHLHVKDAFPFLKQADRTYDLIVVDSTDTYEDEKGALSEMLFTEEFYKDCLNALADDGLLVTQADNLVFCPYSLEAILGLFNRVFARTGAYQALVPSFGGYSGFAWGSKGREIKTRFQANSDFRYLNAATYDLAFSPLHF